MFLVKYNELFLKSRIVRKKMIDRLVNNIVAMGENLKVKRLSDSLIVKGNAEDILKRTFGVQSFSEVTECMKDINKIKDKAKEFAEKFSGKRFRITAMRSDKSFPLTSKDIENEIGSLICSLGFKADLTKPENTIYIEIKDNCYLYSKIQKGPCGLPFGVSGRMLSIIKNEKSVISTWLMMKRGIEPIFIIENEILLLENLFSWIPVKPIFAKKSEMKNIIGIISDEVIDEYNYPHYNPTLFMDKKEIERIKKIILGK